MFIGAVCVRKNSHSSDRGKQSVFVGTGVHSELRISASRTMESLNADASSRRTGPVGHRSHTLSLHPRGPGGDKKCYSLHFLCSFTQAEIRSYLGSTSDSGPAYLAALPAFSCAPFERFLRFSNILNIVSLLLKEMNKSHMTRS